MIMRQLIIAILLPFALTATGQGFISPRAKIAKKHYEQKTAQARTRGEAVDEDARMKLFVTCAKDADAREVANATKKVGAKVRMVKGDLIVLDIPYSKLEALSDVKGVKIISMPPEMSKKTDVTRQVTQAEEVIDGSGSQLPQAYTGKDVIVGIFDSGFDLTHPMFKDKDGHLLPQEFYEKLDENVKNIAMTYIVRPYWDRCIFNAYGAEVYVDEKVMETIIPDFVNGNTATMAVFLVKAGKKAIL